MNKSFEIIPKFDEKILVNDVIKKEWFLFQAGALSIGKRLHSYMRRYINNNRHRNSGTGKLARSINFEIHSTGMGRLEWAIGNINQLVPYWHVIATGKTVSGQRFRPGGGQYRPATFTDGDADSSLRGKGNAKATGFIPIGGGKKPSYVRPIPFISVTSIKLSYELENLIARLARS